MPTAKVTNIFGMSGMTRSGCIFAPPELPARSKDKGKAKVDMGEREKTGLTTNNEGKAREDVVKRGKIGPATNNEAPIKKPMKEADSFGRKEISVEEATEFLRIIQHSEFKVI